jgi:hypothetical protein
MRAQSQCESSAGFTRSASPLIAPTRRTRGLGNHMYTVQSHNVLIIVVVVVAATAADIIYVIAAVLWRGSVHERERTQKAVRLVRDARVNN